MYNVSMTDTVLLLQRLDAKLIVVRLVQNTLNAIAVRGRNHFVQVEPVWNVSQLMIVLMAKSVRAVFALPAQIQSNVQILLLQFVVHWGSVSSV